MAQRFSLDFKNRFFWRIQKKWFLVKLVPKGDSLWIRGRGRRPLAFGALPPDMAQAGALDGSQGAPALREIYFFR